MNSIKKYVWYAPLAVVVAVYATQGLAALIGSEEHHAIISVLGLSASMTVMLGYLVAPLDLGVAALLTWRPSKWIFVWAALWTWVPRTLEFMGGLPVEFGGSLVVTIAAVLAYMALTKKGIRFFGGSR